ncbi:right-handed parallel beta-helix repeat-containing protein [Acidicapsa dinghuensis]|uniref:Right-handed parallel beta-helix repeat-containing protein n=1 Tax=Acidicapsa dinghuensis TaxID=2218256 RepID=A0ABW1EIZ6_9BACT|nr:right-handed parallel beta-helix repeat-containing protein [Acidicapsa dinghuensis]
MKSITISILVTIPLLLAALNCTLPARAANVVHLTPGADVAKAVLGAPEDTTFLLATGTYRMQSVKPKNGDVFQGQAGVIFNGSQILTFEAIGNLWYANAKFDHFEDGKCEPSHPFCVDDQDLFIDGKYQTPAASKMDLPSGSWYFDHLSNQVYLPDNPEGHTVELGMSKYAFFGAASGVKLIDIVVEKYANPGQTGAIGGDTWGNGLGAQWSLQNVESRWNHGAGAYLGAGGMISKSSFHHNGQIGVKMIGANTSLIDSDIGWNNQQGFDTGWEAGGAKFGNTSNLVVKLNHVHDNLGEGLWTDTNNINTTYEQNIVENNLSGGIMHEVSYSALIKNNTISGNAAGVLVWLENAQILIQNSSNVEVVGNTVVVPASGGNGITLVNQKRGGGTNGPWVVQNDRVHDNTITYLGPKGYSGIADDTKPHTSNSNSFDGNRYILKGGGANHWYWYYDMSWDKMTQIGRQEAHGNCCN